ncbi:MAG: beta-lactamase family protein [Gemmatimonadetes bacterium]|nr:beta-lactamase family protein [Gemmatimonadota bacterium]
MSRPVCTLLPAGTPMSAIFFAARVPAWTPLLFALLSLVMPPFARSVPAQAPTLPEVTSLGESLAGRATPGLAMVLIRGDSIVHRSGHGLADLSRRTPFTPGTPSYVASVAKMFTALAVLRLVDEGTLALDTTLGAVLPSAPEYAADVTLRQMLTHTSGIVDHYDIGGTERRWTTSDVHALLDEVDSLLFVPGSNNSYSNSAYVLLAEVVARASGQAYAGFLREAFFTPLGMAATTVAETPDARPSARAIGYRDADGGFVPHDYESSTVGAGGIYTSVDDLARFALALRAGRVVSDSLLALAQTAVIRTDGQPTPYGMGWLSETGPVEGRGEVAYVAAVGSLRGFWALFQWFHEDDAVVIWVSNAEANTTFDALLPLGAMVLAR